MKSTYRFIPITALLMLMLFQGCVTSNPPPQKAAQDVTTEKRVVLNYAEIVYASYSDSLTAARAMQQSIEAFLQSPSPTTLQTARKSWIAARLPYLQTEVCRFYNGPIDDEDGPEGLLNAWPMDEAYVDYVKGAPNSGIINNNTDFPQINKTLIRELNELNGEQNISAGYHAIEFLLWGQDLDAAGPGNRPYTDYTTAPYANRRKRYLQATTELLIEHLERLVADWTSNTNNYRKTFEEAEPTESIKKILSGMSLLTGFELAGERLLVALESKSQEDEHSCFSDTTHNDAIYDLQGIQNVWHGKYQRVDGSMIEGKGLRDWARHKAPEAVEKVDQFLESASQYAKELPVPFDQAILQPEDSEASKAILRLIEKLEDTADQLQIIGTAYGFTVPRNLEE